jgi:glycosyltransferase involved in cell wall biosynthesis
MNILHLHTTLDPESGGPSAVVARLASAQAALGHTVHVMAYEDPAAERRLSISLEDVPGWSRVVFHRLKRPNRVESWLAADMARQLRPLLPSIDVLHTHNTWSPMVLRASRLARRHGVPYVHCPHGALDPWCLAQKPLKKRVALGAACRAMLEGARFVHVLNTSERHRLAPLSLTAPLEIIPNGVFVDELEPPRHQTAGERFGAGRDAPPYILFLSRLHAKKGLDHLVETFRLVASRHATVRLVVAGPDNGAQADFERRVKTAGLGGRVDIIGPIYGRRKVALLRAAVCFCLMSRQEGFSLAITEALACCLPVVISDHCHFPEVSDAGAGYIVGLDPRSASNALLSLLANAQERSVMGRSGERLVRERFTWPAIARQAIERYRAYGVGEPARATFS